MYTQQYINGKYTIPDLIKVLEGCAAYSLFLPLLTVCYYRPENLERSF